MSAAYLTLLSEDIFLNAGRSLAGTDFDGDGRGDILIGADLGENAGSELSGKVVIVFGAPPETSAIDLDDATLYENGAHGLLLEGDSEDDGFGWSVQNLGDVTGDGLDDVAIAAQGKGSVYIVKGDAAPDFGTGTLAIGDLVASGSAIELTGLPALADEIFVTPGGDLDEDGLADIVVSVSSGGVDEVYVLYGGSTTTDLSTLDGTEGFKVTGLDLANASGANTGAIGDLDGDGFGDILLGHPGPDEDGNDSGDIVFLLSGYLPSGGSIDIDDLSATETLTLTGLDASAAPGASVAGRFDLNGDGFDDVAVSAIASDAGGVNAGQVFVVFGADGLEGEVDLTTLDGSNGFEITGLAAGDELGTVVQGLGDVSGDGRDDLGLLTASGDLYVIFGVDSATGFDASFDLATINGSNGIAVTGLFDEVPEHLTLSAIPSLNGDAINEIAVGGLYDVFTGADTKIILGGTRNFAALDDADGAEDFAIDFSALGEVEFVETDTSLILSGDTTGSLGEDDATTEGSIGITDTEPAPGDEPPSFAGVSRTGDFGTLIVNAAGDIWTYTITDNEALQFLNEGEQRFDKIQLVEPSTGATQTVTITIEGSDDAAVFTGEDTPFIGEDIGQFTETFTITDVDDDVLGFTTLRFDGSHGHVIVEETGTEEEFTYTYFLTDASVQSLGTGASLSDTITLTDDAGNDYDLVITIDGADEGATVTYDTTDPIRLGLGGDIIETSAGDDDINTGGGDDSVKSGGGKDVIVDPTGNDHVESGDDSDSVLLLSGDNYVDGGAGGDLIRTGYGNDEIHGGAGDDVISADSLSGFLFGNDTISGGTGNDLMEAGAGADTFVFAPGDGDDTIASFNEVTAALDAGGTFYVATPTGRDFTSGIDRVLLDGFSTVNAGNVMDFVTDGTSGAVFSAEGTSITFYGVFEADLSADDFVFLLT